MYVARANASLLFITEMSSPGTINELGQSQVPPGTKLFNFEVPVSRPVEVGHTRAGTNKDMGALVLFLVANWFVDGETVLIDGGVRTKLLVPQVPYLTDYGYTW